MPSYCQRCCRLGLQVFSPHQTYISLCCSNHQPRPSQAAIFVHVVILLPAGIFFCVCVYINCHEFGGIQANHDSFHLVKKKKKYIRATTENGLRKRDLEPHVQGVKGVSGNAMTGVYTCNLGPPPPAPNQGELLCVLWRTHRRIVNDDDS